MTGYAIRISRKQIGVVYAATKRGDMNLGEEIVSWLYNSCTDHQFNYNNVNAYLELVKEAIEKVFKNEYASAEALIREAFAEYSRKHTR